MRTEEIYNQALEVYAAFKQVAELSEHDYCLSWWINTRNFPMKTTMSTSTITRRAALLVKKGYLTIDKLQTSRSSGTCYKFTNLKP